MISLQSILLLLLAVAIISFIIYQIYFSIRIEKHDSVLYRLRSTKDNLVLLLVDNYENDSLSNYEKLEIRHAITSVSIITMFFNKTKSGLTFRRISSILFSTNSLFLFQQKESNVSHPLMQQAKRDVATSMMYAFGQYVPFFKVRLLMRFITALTKIALFANMKQVVAKSRKLTEWQNALDRYNEAEHTFHEHQTCEV